MMKTFISINLNVNLLPMFVVVFAAILISVAFGLFISSSIKEVKTNKRDIELIDKLISEKTIKVVKRKKITKIVKNVLFYAFLVILIPFLAYSIVLRIKGSEPKIGNTIIMVVGSGSMSFKNEANDYLYSINDERRDYQFNKGDIIFLTVVTSDSELEQYDVICFDNGSENIIHRIKDLEIKDNKTIYTTRGDANNQDDDFIEGGLTIDNVIGEYHGKKLSGIGNLVLFLQNPIGMSTIFCLLYLLIIIDYFLKKLSKAENGKASKFEKVIGYVDLNVKYFEEDSSTKESKEIDFNTISIYYLGICFSFNKDGFIKKENIDQNDDLFVKSQEVLIKKIEFDDTSKQLEYKINKN